SMTRTPARGPVAWLTRPILTALLSRWQAPTRAPGIPAVIRFTSAEPLWHAACDIAHVTSSPRTRRADLGSPLVERNGLHATRRGRAPRAAARDRTSSRGLRARPRRAGAALRRDRRGRAGPGRFGLAPARDAVHRRERCRRDRGELREVGGGATAHRRELPGRPDRDRAGPARPCALRDGPVAGGLLPPVEPDPGRRHAAAAQDRVLPAAPRPARGGEPHDRPTLHRVGALPPSRPLLGRPCVRRRLGDEEGQGVLVVLLPLRPARVQDSGHLLRAG